MLPIERIVVWRTLPTATTRMMHFPACMTVILSSCRAGHSLNAALQSGRRVFFEDPRLQYVVVKNVSIPDYEHIDFLRDRGDLPQMKILYDEEEELMIVKLIPGMSHEVTSTMFNDLFREVVPYSIGIMGVGSTRFGEASRRHKEPDQSYMQNTTRYEVPDSWPSVVLEVGASESLHQLQEDARYWLITSVGQVFCVILISIDLSIGGMVWERWEHIPSQGPATQGRASNIHPTLMQTVTVPARSPTIGAPFRIPSNKIWDIVPANVGAEILFTAQHLETISERLVAGLH